MQSNELEKEVFYYLHKVQLSCGMVFYRYLLKRITATGLSNI